MADEKAWWIFALPSAFFAALTTVFSKIGVKNINSNLATAIRTVVILAILEETAEPNAWGIVWANGQLQGLLTLSPRTLVFLVLSGIATGLSWLCYFRALQLGNASLVAPVDKSGLILVLLLSVLFLGEPLTIQVVVGTALVLAGTLVLVL